MQNAKCSVNLAYLVELDYYPPGYLLSRIDPFIQGIPGTAKTNLPVFADFEHEVTELE